MQYVTARELNALYQVAAEARARSKQLTRESAELRSAITERRIVRANGRALEVLAAIELAAADVPLG